MSGGDPYGISPFAAPRPLSSAELTVAKLKATIWSTVTTWSLVVAAIPVALRWTRREEQSDSDFVYERFGVRALRPDRDDDSK